MVNAKIATFLKGTDPNYDQTGDYPTPVSGTTQTLVRHFKETDYAAQPFLDGFIGLQKKS